jgi:hypothetical protein
MALASGWKKSRSRNDRRASSIARVSPRRGLWWRFTYPLRARSNRWPLRHTYPQASSSRGKSQVGHRKMQCSRMTPVAGDHVRPRTMRVTSAWNPGRGCSETEWWREERRDRLDPEGSGYERRMRVWKCITFSRCHEGWSDVKRDDGGAFRPRSCRYRRIMKKFGTPSTDCSATTSKPKRS